MDSALPANQDSGGDWIAPQVSYVNPQRVACALCGRPIARRYWQARIRERELPFCGPDHAELYETYWIPTYGPDADKT